MSVSGFYKTDVIGKLRPPAQILSWFNIMLNPSGWRHIESGVYKPIAKSGLVGGFQAQQASGTPLSFGHIYVNDNGFYTDTAVVTFNLGEVNSNKYSYFYKCPTIGQNFKAFNMKFWLMSSGAFSGCSPTFLFKTFPIWQSGLNLRSETSGVQVVPLSLPSTQNVFTKGSNIYVSGCYLEKEFTNFIYIVGKFPSGSYILGTYGDRKKRDFIFRLSYDYTDINANTLYTDID